MISFNRCQVLRFNTTKQQSIFIRNSFQIIKTFKYTLMKCKQRNFMDTSFLFFGLAKMTLLVKY